MVDNYVQIHLFTVTTEVEHLTEIVDTQETKVIEPLIIIIIIIVDTRTEHTVIIDHTATIDLMVIIDHKTDMITITETDHRVITETIITKTIQITGIVLTATTEIPTVQFQIIVMTKDTIHDHQINLHDHRTSPDHHIIEIETLIAIMEVDITTTIEIED